MGEAHRARMAYYPTEEQECVTSAFLDGVLDHREEDERGIVIPAESPAGTGKTQTTINIMKRLQTEAPEKKIAYFVFNNFMKEEIRVRAHFAEIENTNFYTYHSFLLQHALKNEKLKKYFHDKEGNPLIDFAKQGYSRKDIAEASVSTLGFAHQQAQNLLWIGFQRWLNSDKSLQETMRALSYEVFSDQRDPTLARAVSDINDLGEALAQAHERLSSFLPKPPSGVLGREALAYVFLAFGAKKIMTEMKLTHSGYYKQVYTIAKEMKIDLFEAFDGIIVDEAQDIDPIFHHLVLTSKKPLLLIGDRNQGIYGWRGAVNMMEEVAKHHKPYPLSYSFRYRNDLAEFCNTILNEKEHPPVVDVVGRYTDSLESFPGGGTLSGMEQFAEYATMALKRRLSEAEDRFGEPAHKIKKTELRKFLAREKVACICRSNATLIQSVFGALALLKNNPLREYFQISLTGSVSEELKKIEKGEFDARTQAAISREILEDYTTFKQGKPLELILENPGVKRVLSASAKYSFLMDEKSYGAYKSLMQELSSRKGDSVKKEDKLANLVFTTAHGSKGKEFHHVFVADDFLRPNKEGAVEEEEINLAYVACSRAKETLHFLSAHPGEPHSIRELFVSNKDKILEEIRKPYLYRFHDGSSVNISKVGNMYSHEIKGGKGESLGFFLLDRPLSTLQGGFGARGLECLRWYDEDKRGYRYLTPDGEDVPEGEVRRLDRECVFSYATGANPGKRKGGGREKAACRKR